MSLNTMDYDCVLVRYGEIGLKGRNRGFFERKLVSNIKWALKKAGAGFKDVKRIQGRFVVDTGDVKALDALGRVFGAVSYSPALKVKPSDAGEAAVRLVREKSPRSFRITARRLDKSIETTSQKINEEVGAQVVAATCVRVDLKNPDLDVGVDATKTHAYVHAETIRGLGGLPVGVSARAVCLLSGGIDSPVAAWLMMKRGCSVTLLHFQHGGRTPSKIKSLYEILAGYDPKLRLVVVPASELEREIVAKIPARYRIIMLRRMFLKIAGKIMKEEGAHAVVTGDNIGQVASQTLENMEAVQNEVGGLILRPLACMDKREVIAIAESIGTYEASILPYVDCCSFLLPQHPETRADAGDLLEMESLIDPGIAERVSGKKTLL